MSALARYRETVRVPYVGRLLALGLVARLTPAIEYLAVVLFIRDLTGSYALAGAVTAAYTVGFAVASPFQGRMIDRLGPSRVLWPLAISHAVTMGALVAAGLADRSGLVLVLLGLVTGAFAPPTGAAVRRVLTQQAANRRDLMPSVFALEALCAEIVFMGGPVITALIILVASPQAALMIACGVAIVAVAGLVAVPAVQKVQSTEMRGRLGALRSPGMRTLIGCMAPIGVVYGAVQVALIAFADHVDASSSAPWLFALMAFGGAVGVIVYGALGHRLSSSVALIVGACLLPVCLVPMILATSLIQMAVLVAVGGIFLTPIIAITNQIVGDVAPADAVTESYAWIFMASLSGSAIGLVIAGNLVDSSDWRAAMLVAIGATVVTAVVAVSRRRTLPYVGWERASTEAA